MTVTDQDAPLVGAGPVEIADTEPLYRELVAVDALAEVIVPISSLRVDQSPRHGGENEEHARVLAESNTSLPPIVVHGPSMQVIDGIHRVRAAILRGDEALAAKIYHGSDDDAFLLSVRLNIAHGLPLTRAERTAAAVRITHSYSQWSDRMIAATVGLSHRTIAKARQRSSGHSVQSTTRVGQDGRVRPINPAAGRLRVAALLEDHPTAPLRQIAHQAGVSPSTVHQVRQRLRTGQPPNPDHHRVPSHPHQPRTTGTDPHHPTPTDRTPAGEVDIAAIFGQLKKDPALQANDTTHSLLRSLDRYCIDLSHAHKLITMIPPHCARSVAQLAHHYARTWTHIATQLDPTTAQSPIPPFPNSDARPPYTKTSHPKPHTIAKTATKDN